MVQMFYFLYHVETNGLSYWNSTDDKAQTSIWEKNDIFIESAES